MARSLFGVGTADYVVTLGTGNAAVLAAGASLTAWNAETGGTQYADLAQDPGGATPVSTWLSGDGTSGTQIGRPAPVYGPDDVTSWWVSANGGPRVLMMCSDLADVVTSVRQIASGTQSSLAAHLSATNPHAVRMTTLADWVPGTVPSDGQAPVWDAAASGFRPGDVSGGGGGTPGVSLSGGSTIRIADGDIATAALRIQLPAGDRTGTAAPNTFAVLWNAGTDAVPHLQETFRLNEYGEVRLQPSAINRIAARIKQFSGSQSADLTQWTDWSNNVLASVSASGAVRAPNLGVLMPFSLSGAVAVKTGTHRLYNDAGVPLVIRAVRASAGTAPTGADIVVDVKKSGTSIFGATKPTIPAGANTSGKLTAIEQTTLADGEYLTVDVTQVGSTVAGADLTVQVLAY